MSGKVQVGHWGKVLPLEGGWSLEQTPHGNKWSWQSLPELKEHLDNALYPLFNSGCSCEKKRVADPFDSLTA